MSYDIAKRKAETLLPGVSNFSISADGKKMLYAQGNSFFIASAAGKPAPGEGRLNMADLKVWVDPRQEWAQMFDEDWRLQRDYFYVENLHGANWPAIRKRFEQFLPHVAHREDLSYLINQMNAELVIGHNYVRQGDYPEAIQVNVGMLGADYELANSGVRIKKIYRGMDWMPGVKPPLTQPGVEVKEGDYIIAVNGVRLDGNRNIYQLMENTAGKQTRLLVNSTPAADGAREYTVLPLASEFALRDAQWVAERHRKVQELSNGRLAYVYLPNTGGEGYTYFNRMYFAQVDKEGVVVDERFNGGGSAADYICDFLARKTMNYWKNRTGAIMRTPEAVIDGPLVMVANGYAGSGGDLLPYMFKKRQMGPVVGTTTNGILVGIYNYPVLMDGGSVTAPRLGIFSTEGKWVVENEGVAPDVEVEELPKDVIAGKDPQLEKAVELAMKQLKPRTEVKAPKDPVRAVN
jgi:tricorn protease